MVRILNLILRADCAEENKTKSFPSHKTCLAAIIPDNRTKIHGNVIIIICDSEFLNTLTALFLVVKMSINNWARKREANKFLKKIKKQFT